ncbi:MULTISPECIES: hemin uptake protein HemP [unclassified Bosea (in: a-proteobacteria)]|uniref:hemin uptake protein HemP n=1 Tax=unclassified Bosea (in: a-proteobacteria) TaxID=2653178 RepID=UPI003006E81B
MSRSPEREHRRLRSVVMRPARTLFSGVVFEGEAEIGIDHHGELYRLKITRQGKLILTK